MRSATKRKLDLVSTSAPATRSATRPKLDAVGHSKAAATRPTARSKPRVFHATMQVTRLEEWFIEAATAAEARELLESGNGQRLRIGECTHFEISKLVD